MGGGEATIQTRGHRGLGRALKHRGPLQFSTGIRGAKVQRKQKYGIKRQNNFYYR